VGNSDKVQRFVTLSLNNFPVDLPASKLKEALDGIAGFVRSVAFVPVQLLATSLRWPRRSCAGVFARPDDDTFGSSCVAFFLRRIGDPSRSFARATNW
jgi:hypothetical protein